MRRRVISRAPSDVGAPRPAASKPGAPGKPGSLLGWLQGVIERTYALPRGLGDASRYVMGDLGWRRLQETGVETLRVIGNAGGNAGPGPGACLFLRPDSRGGAWRASIYYPDAMIARLEAHPPTAGLNDRNIDDFAALVEELDHLLCVAARLAAGHPFSLLELEIQAYVTKYLASARMMASGEAGRHLEDGARAWLRWRLFERGDFIDADARVRARYQDARRFAARYLRRIEPLPAAARLASLRNFHRSTHHEKLALLA